MKIFIKKLAIIFSLAIFAASPVYANNNFNEQYQQIKNQQEDQRSPKRAVKTPIYKCIECGGWHGGAFYPYCQWCFLKK